MFWRKKDQEKKAIKKIEGPLWGYMVQKGVIVDVLQNLRYVAADTEVDGKPCFCIRIFDPTKVDAAGITVEDFRTFDDHPGHILYEGYMDSLEQPKEINIQKK
jgi:hypothetical protein